MKRIAAYLFSIQLMIGAAHVALAHGVTKPQHGGQVQMSGEAHFELVQDPQGVALYVLNEDEPVDAKAMTAKLHVSSGGKKAEVAMAASQGNRFFAEGLKLASGSTVAVQVIDNETKSRLGATFTIP